MLGFEFCDNTSALEIAKGGANLVSDRQVDFSRNLESALADFYGHYSSQDLHMRTGKMYNNCLAGVFAGL